MAFDTIIGNNRIKQDLRETVKNGTISHSYLFMGQDGIGKVMFAREFAKLVLCLSENNGCDICSSCIKFNSGNNPDYIELEPEGNAIKISQVRKMQEDIYQKPIVSNKKVIIINDSDKMTEEAQNSLLKTLEEPPEYIVIILIASNENKLLNTIKSRCLKISFSSLSKEEIMDYINKNTVPMPSGNILDACNGSLGMLTKINESLEQYVEIDTVTNKFINGQINNIVEMINQYDVLYKSKDIALQLLDYMMGLIYHYISKNEDYRTRFLNLIFIIEQSKKKLTSNCNYDMCIDDLLIKMWELNH